MLLISFKQCVGISMDRPRVNRGLEHHFHHFPLDNRLRLSGVLWQKPRLDRLFNGGLEHVVRDDYLG